MIKFISHNQISGSIELNTPSEMLQIEIKENSPVVYQMRFEQGKTKVLRDISHIRDNIYVCKPSLPKEFILSDLQTKARILIYSGESFVETNPIAVSIHKENFNTFSKNQDVFKEMEGKLIELERQIKTLSFHQKPIDLQIPNLGVPQEGMVITALTPSIFGWSHVFKTAIQSINGRSPENKNLELTTEHIPAGKNTLDVVLLAIHTRLKRLEEEDNKNKDALIKIIGELTKLQIDFVDYTKRDIL